MVDYVIDTFQRLRNSKFRLFVWPIRSYELKKFIPITLLMFFILMNQNMIRAAKDSFVLSIIGSEILSFIKLWGEMPAGILFVVLYAKLCNVVSTEAAFRIILSIFIGFFLIFAFILFPYQEFFHPDPSLVEGYITSSPHLRWFFVMWSQWSLVLFYVMGELWPVVVFSLLFWQLANNVVKTEEARRFYAFFNFFGQINLIITGYILKNRLYVLQCFEDISCDNEVAIKSLVSISFCFGVIALLIHRFIEKEYILSKKHAFFKHKRTDVLKLSLRESIKMTLSSKYLMAISVLVIGYGTIANLIEGLWMSKVRELHVSAIDVMSYIGSVFSWVGVSALFFSFFGSAILRFFGWFWAAALTPIAFFILGGMFFLLVVVNKAAPGIIPLSPELTLSAIVFMGGAQAVLGKGIKYSLFDATKEMAYIPLDNEMKTKGKAAVDVVGVKIGKSMGAIIQIIAFSISPFATHTDIAQYLMVAFLSACVVWMFGVSFLNKRYSRMVENDQ